MPMLLSYSACFGIYTILNLSAKSKRTVWCLLGLGIALRCLLLFGFPNLSDDIYRFIWDGQLSLAGINPFNYLPSELLEQNIPGITPALYAELNSPEYYTIYPPVGQGIFALAVAVGAGDWITSALVMKICLFLFECGSLWLMVRLVQHFELPLERVLWYALNPLIIIEITGNLHFEGAMTFFFLLAYWLLVTRRQALSAIAMALSVASKLLPLMLLPLLIRRLGWAKSIRYFGIMGLVLLLLFSPLLNATFIANFGSSLDLYFQKFEFNASVYYLLRSIGEWIYGYNLIAKLGPFLGLSVLGGILWLSWREHVPSNQTLATTALLAFSLYLALATTIHPWYLSFPLALAAFGPFRYPVLWSGLIFLTYINYSYDNYWENLWIVALEYVLVYVLFIREWLKNRSVILSNGNNVSSS